MNETLLAHPEDDLAAYALGALEDAEREAVAAHVAACSACTAEVSAYLHVTEDIRREGTEYVPAPQSWERIRGRLGDAAAERQDRAATPPRQGRVLHFGGRALAAWGIAAAVVAGLLAWNIALQLDSGDSPLAASLPGKDTYVYVVTRVGSGNGSGRVFMSEDLTRGTVAVSGLPQLQGTSQYTAWLVRDDQTRVKVASFGVDSRGDAVARLTLPAVLRGFSGFAISVSSSGDVTSPDGPDVLVGPLY